MSIELLTHQISQFSDFLWSGPLLIILIGVGIYQTWQIRGLQFFRLPLALRLIFSKNCASNQGDISAFQSLMTALAGSVGTGSIAGIATAITTGGLGALFWMWVIAAFGMATAYAETLLAVKYRKANANNMAGGPMYYLQNRLNSKIAAKSYALFTAIAVVGIGCIVQSHSVTDAICEIYPASRIIIGIMLAIIVGSVLIGGVKKIGKVAGLLVPFMAIGYVTAGIFVLLVNYHQIIPALHNIIACAFKGQAAVGGFVGSSVIMAMQTGAQYGIFANEAGWGSLAIAAASAKTEQPVEQGLRSIGGVFFATMVMCSLTGLVLAVTNVIGATANGQLIQGSPLVMLAFASAHQTLSFIVLISLILFVFTTMLAWSYYGEKCTEYLFGCRSVKLYRLVFTLAIILGAVLAVDLVWALANFASAFMALPNLIAICCLAKEVKAETTAYFKDTTMQTSFVASPN